MRSFNHVDSYSIQETCELLTRYGNKAKLNAGGTDLLSVLKGDFLPEYPEVVINIKTIPDLDYIQQENNSIKIGALTRLTGIVKSDFLKEHFPLLVEAAVSVGSPQIRNIATIGGNLCQDVRCWYYRYPAHIGGYVKCPRKGSDVCPAVKGDNRYHALFEAKKCFAVCPSDIAVALTALNGKVIITGPEGERSLDINDFYHPLGNALKENEFVKEVEIPGIDNRSRQKFLKFTLRKPIDFAIVSAAAFIVEDKGICRDARLVLGAVSHRPFIVKDAGKIMQGKAITGEIASEVAENAVAGAKPLAMNGYKIEIAKSLVRDSILQ